MKQRQKMPIGERTCQICGKDRHSIEIVPAALVRPAVAGIIKEKYPDWSSDGFICMEDLDHYRNEYVRTLFEAERGELSSMEQEVLESLKTHGEREIAVVPEGPYVIPLYAGHSDL